MTASVYYTMSSSGDHNRGMDAKVVHQATADKSLCSENDHVAQLLVQKTFTRKGRPNGCSDTASQRVSTQSILQESNPQPQPALRVVRGLKQTHLDLGQAGFHCLTCPLCGMTYAPGEEVDEKLHAAHHAKLVQGIRFHGWQNERVLHRELLGYVLLVLPTDPAPHLKKVREMAELLEDQLGLVHGWLMSVPCKVYLYVSASKRVVGCVMLQSIQSACPAVPAEDPAASTGDSSAGALASRAPLSAWLQPAAQPVTAGLYTRAHADPRHRTGIFSSPGLTVSNTQECSDTLAVGRSVFSEPVGLQSQSRGHLQALTPLSLSACKALNSNAAPTSLPELCHTAPVKSRKRSWAPLGMLGSKRASLGSLGAADCQSKAQLKRQQSFLAGWLAAGEAPSSKQEAGRGECSMAAPPSPSASCCSGASEAGNAPSRAPSAHRDVLVERDLNQQSASSGDRATGGAMSPPRPPQQQQHERAGSEHVLCGQTSLPVKPQIAKQLSRAAVRRPLDLRGQGRAPLLVDESTRVPAVCGVRVVWVSVDARRQGIASKLLDLARCNFLAGYVVPRHELAFSQPTEQGRSFAASYTGSQKLLVYQ